MRARYSNDVFFAGASAEARVPVVPEHEFYAARERPPPEKDLLARASATPMRYALVLFLAGWAGILFQAEFLQQVVFGAPLFEELAKLGPPLALVALLGIRTNWVRLPLAWLSGGAFGVMEHYVTYPEEAFEVFVERIVFHGGATGLSMLTYGALESLPDTRARWASTLPATLLHWAFNFGAVLLGVAGVLLPIPEPVGFAYAILVTGAVLVVTLWGILDRAGYERRVQAILETAMPRLARLRADAPDARPPG